VTSERTVNTNRSERGLVEGRRGLIGTACAWCL